jgi:DegV family protein with EDD domain
MSEKILLASDSTTDLNEELIERYGVKVLPLTVMLGDKSYVDGVDITPDDIYAHYEKTGELPKTSAVNIVDFHEAYKRWTDEGYSVIVFTIGAGMSSTHNNARLAAEDFDNVFVVDTNNLSTGGGLLLCAAGDMVAEGKLSACEIARRCCELAPCVDASFVIDSLEFLYKGGRCSSLEAFGANLLQLKPCIAVKDGKLGATKKYRGRFGDILPKYVSDRIGDASDIVTDRIFVTHAGCDMELVERCAEQVRTLVPTAEVHITRAGCTVSSHCGQNTLGVLFIRKCPVA